MKLSRINIYGKQSLMMFQDVLIYRADFITRFISWGTRFLISVYLWMAIVESKGGIIAGYDLEKTLTYFLLIQIISAFVFCGGGFQISSDIQSGELSTKLIQPVDYLMLLLSREFGRNFFFFLGHLLIYGAIVLAFPSLFEFKFNIFLLLLASLSLIFAFIINFCMNIIIGLSAFWITTANRLIYTFFALITLVSGIIIPIEFFPEKIQKILEFTPFPYIFYYPVYILQLNNLDPQIIKGISIQLFYSILLILIMYLIYYIGLKVYEAVGK